MEPDGVHRVMACHDLHAKRPEDSRASFLIRDSRSLYRARPLDHRPGREHRRQAGHVATRPEPVFAQRRADLNPVLLVERRSAHGLGLLVLRVGPPRLQGFLFPVALLTTTDDSAL